MKQLSSYLILLCLLSFNSIAQLSNGGFHANFGVDADTRSGYQKCGSGSGSRSGDDWFASSKSGKPSVLDTSNAKALRALLQSNRNISFTKNMSEKLYSKINGTLWLDAIYMRDYTAALGSDSTAFGSAAKNGADPRVWNGTATNIPGKTDFIDTYAHFRRNGTSVTDSLWFFTGISTLSTQGERYFDVELFKNQVSYNPSTGTFGSSGLSFGHTEWIFDAFGKLIQTGDLIFAVSYKSGEAPVIDVRIWVSNLTFNTVQPALFKFGANFDSSVPGGAAGYATIVSNSGNTEFGSGVGNFSPFASNDTTNATPWGTISKTAAWSANYESLQFVEIGVNFTRIGIDPALYINLASTACDRVFHSIFFKSRSSNSFSANLQDFAGPINFSVPALDFDVVYDNLTCIKSIGTITLDGGNTSATYNWDAIEGEIIDYNADSSIITFKGVGRYSLVSILAKGCPKIRAETITIFRDSIAPVATADIGVAPSNNQMQLLGGDTAASKVMTPFGGSQGLLWDWKGPNGFTSSIQNPVNDSMWAWGTYQLTVTEVRNGCKSTAYVDVIFYLTASANPASETKEAGVSKDLPLIAKSVDNSIEKKMYLAKNSGSNGVSLMANSRIDCNGKLAIFNTTGQLVGTKNFRLYRGQNTIEIPSNNSNRNSVQIISVYLEGQLAFTGKASY